MYKKIMSGLILCTLLISLLLPLPKGFAAGSTGVLQFQDDFSAGMSLWNGINGSWVVDNGALRVTSSSSNNIEMKGTNSVWQDQIVDFRLKILETPGGGFTRVYTRYSSNTSNLSLMIRPNGLSYTINGSSEVSLSGYKFTVGSNYDIKMNISGSTVTVYAKTESETNYTSVGTITGIPVQSGKVRFSTFNDKVQLDNVSVVNLRDLAFMANGNILSSLNVGSQSNLQLINATGNSVIWTSGDAAKATVDGNGVVTGLSRGLVTITAATADNLSQVKFDIYVKDPVDSIGVLQFQDDFSNGMNLWNPVQGTWMVDNSRLSSTTTASSLIELKGANALWRNQTISMRFNRGDNLAGNFISIKLRYVSESDYTRLLIRGTGLSYIKAGGTEQSFYSAAFNQGIDYDIKLAALDDSVQVYVKSAADADYTFAGAISNVAYSFGKVQLTTYNLKATIDDIKIWNHESSKLVMGTKLAAYARGNSAPIPITNKTGKSVVLSSSNHAVATVDQTGVVTAVAKGQATITAATYDGSYQDKSDVIVYVRPTGVSLNKASTSLYVGESEELTATIVPTDADNPFAVWSISDPSVASLIGGASKSRAIKALSAGTTTVTVTTVDGGFSATTQVTVNPIPGQTVSSAEFQIDTTQHALPPYLLGGHNEQVLKIGRVTDFQPASHDNLGMELKLQNVRGPDGTGADFYMYNEGTLINSKDPRYQQFYGNKTIGAIENVSLKPGFPGLSLANSYHLANTLGVPYVYDLNVISQSVDEILTQIREMKQLTTQPIYVEMGNELYSIFFDKAFLSVNEYIAKCKLIYQGIKNIDPTIKVGIVAVAKDLEDRIAADPNNQPDPNVDWGATQGGRVAAWNQSLAQDASFYDAIIVHVYSPIPYLNDLTNSKMMDYLYTYNQSALEGLIIQKNQFPGKEMWVTEWSSLPTVIFGETDLNEKARKQFMKTPGFAIHSMERVLQMIESGAVTITDVHAMVDTQGFGIVQQASNGDLVKLPNFHVFKALGDLLDANSSYYKINLAQGNVQNEKLRFIATNVYYNVADVGAWGFGDASGIKKVVFANRTMNPVNVSVPGAALKTNWIYGGENPLPDYLTNPNASWLDAPQVNPLPEAPVSSFAGQIQLQPYSMTIVDITDVAAPVTTASMSPAQPDGQNGWYVSPVMVTLTATDHGSGVEKTEYSLDGGITWKIYTNHLSVNADGQHVLSYRSTDIAGNVEMQRTSVINIDMTVPAASVAYSSTIPTNDIVVASITPSEHITITNNGGSNSYSFIMNGSFTFEFVDDAGNQGTATATVNNMITKSKGVPGKPDLSNDNGYDTGIQDGNYRVKMDMWWGDNGRIYKLYENDVLIETQILTDNSPSAQSTVTSVTYKMNGTYRYYAELTNTFGTTRSDIMTVIVTQATPAKPVLSNDNWDGDGNFKVDMNMWWGTNGTTYHLYENGILIYTQAMTSNTPTAQSAMGTVTNRPIGTYEYRAELVNHAGAVSSDKMIVKVTK
ncbi:hypothetical protein ASG85_21210 [Paenibacillus sp. Soil724D2]|nr:hypothetical protein ASG85_21210 [Paenibacillus sp. Soil724D2]